jgi:hypothetical protein
MRELLSKRKPEMETCCPINGAGDKTFTGDVFFFSSYRSEYHVRYRPFTQYEYVGDRFVQSQASLANGSSNGVCGGGGADENKIPLAAARSLQGDPWFKEVVELRKRANDYRVSE